MCSATVHFEDSSRRTEMQMWPAWRKQTFMIPSIERLRKLPVPQVESAASSRNLLNLIGFIPVLTPAETAKFRDDASKKSENGKRERVEQID